MDYNRGKTFRRNPQYIPNERFLSIGSNNADVEAVCIQDNEYSNRVQYSIKKQKRWEMSEFLRNRDSNDDKTKGPSVTYLISQCQTTRDLKDISYYYESETNTEMGSRKVTDRKFMGKPKNRKSILKERNMSNENINQNINNSQKKGRAIEKISNQNYSSKNPSQSNKQGRIEDNHDKEYQNQREGITIIETVPVNNPFYLKKGYKNQIKSKRKTHNKIDIGEDLNDSDFDSFDEDENADNARTASRPRNTFVFIKKEKQRKHSVIKNQIFNKNQENSPSYLSDERQEQPHKG